MLSQLVAKQPHYARIEQKNRSHQTFAMVNTTLKNWSSQVSLIYYSRIYNNNNKTRKFNIFTLAIVIFNHSYSFHFSAKHISTSEVYGETTEVGNTSASSYFSSTTMPSKASLSTESTGTDSTSDTVEISTISTGASSTTAFSTTRTNSEAFQSTEPSPANTTTMLTPSTSADGFTSSTNSRSTNPESGDWTSTTGLTYSTDATYEKAIHPYCDSCRSFSGCIFCFTLCLSFRYLTFNFTICTV